MDTENKVLIGFMAVALIFYLSQIHTSRFEADRIIERDYGIEAELDFEDDGGLNYFEQIEQDRAQFKADSFNVTYSIVR